MVLSKRFEYDGKATIYLNKRRLLAKDELNSKIVKGQYSFEMVKCTCCGSNDFETLAEKDRFGLKNVVVICKKCGLVQTNPRMTLNSYINFYESLYRCLYTGSSKPTEKFFNNQKFHGEKIINFIEKTLNEPIRHKFIVEVGTGAGGILQAFKERDNNVFGVDLDRNYINYGLSHGLNLMTGTIDKLSELDKKPEVIIYSHVLEHILNPLEELKKIRSFLNDGGILYVEVPGIRNLTLNYGMDLLRYLQNAHVYSFTLTTLNNLMRRGGFMMIYGNEEVKAVFKKSDKFSKNYISDYENTMAYLKALEKSILRRFFRSILLVLERTHTLNTLAKVYLKILK